MHWSSEGHAISMRYSADLSGAWSESSVPCLLCTTFHDGSSTDLRYRPSTTPTRRRWWPRAPGWWLIRSTCASTTRGYTCPSCASCRSLLCRPSTPASFWPCAGHVPTGNAWTCGSVARTTLRWCSSPSWRSSSSVRCVCLCPSSRYSQTCRPVLFTTRHLASAVYYIQMLFVCLFIISSDTWFMSKRINTSSNYWSRCTAIIPMFSKHTSRRHPNGVALNRGVKYRWSMTNSRFSTSVWLYNYLETSVSETTRKPPLAEA